jgi:hypothetical protein
MRPVDLVEEFCDPVTEEVVLIVSCHGARETARFSIHELARLVGFGDAFSTRRQLPPRGLEAGDASDGGVRRMVP